MIRWFIDYGLGNFMTKRTSDAKTYTYTSIYINMSATNRYIQSDLLQCQHFKHALINYTGLILICRLNWVLGPLT